MKKNSLSTFMVWAQRCLLLLVLFGISYKLSAQESNAYSVTVKTNAKDLISKGALRKDKTPGRIFVGTDEVTMDLKTGEGKTIIPLKGHEKWDNTWEHVRVRVMANKGFYLQSITWVDESDPTKEHTMKNNSHFEAKSLKGNVIITVTYAQVEEPEEEDEEEPEVETFTVTYNIVAGLGTFEVRHAEVQNGKFILEKGDQLSLELTPEDGYKIGHVKYDGITIEGHKFNSYGIYSLGTIKKNMHFDVTFLKEGEEDTTSIETIEGRANEIYPNPCHNDLFLSRAGQVSIYNLTGVLVHKQAKATTHVDVSKLPQGVYLLKVSQGQQVRVHRLVKR
ncbi:T9SS type A sorting domain-containing protein [Porphyromonas sp. COT-290 OH3588]|uniref:T9SS type A sorting domain-containing protein n=1 Tax=Porphyromonas sp. COT-290 OH3588 TaxID=1515617 RepID=UPI0009E0AF6A|nr:T9SS type A sorting domain-containing protein [Porphyromonas sp. COT-290 OH3588]